MDEDLMLAAFGVTFSLGMMATFLLRPIARGAGRVLGTIVQAGRESIRLPHDRGEYDPELVAHLEERMSLVEDRLAFTEALLSSPRGERIGALSYGIEQDTRQ